jgi:broad specificity phosphatase PhoE
VTHVCVWHLQGNTNESELTALGRVQAVRARTALADMHFDSCFSSPHTRARQTTEIVWQQFQQSADVQEPIYLPSLSEVDLGWFQGLRNGTTCSHCTVLHCAVEHRTVVHCTCSSRHVGST